MKDIDLVSESLARCCQSNNFFDRFYEIFLLSDPRIKPMFANTDFNKQNKVLKAGLANLILFAQGHKFGTSKVEEIALSHSYKNLNIEPEFYPLWQNSLIQTVSEFDPEYNDELGQAWVSVLSAGINKIIENYN